MFRKSTIVLLSTMILVSLSTVAQALDLSGSWAGSWKDSGTGHHGPLWATFVQLEDGNYRVHFRGRFAKIIPFRYSVVLNATEEGDKVLLTGSSDISRRRGTFYYDAEATATDFVSSFRSCKDQGQFVLERCSDGAKASK